MLRMSKRHIIEVAVRILALYLIVQLPMSIWGIMSMLSVKDIDMIRNPFLYKMGAVVSTGLYCIIVIFFLFKAESISKFIIKEDSNELIERQSKPKSLSLWIIVLGIYFCIISITGIVRELIQLPVYYNSSFSLSIIISKVVTLFIAIYMIFNSQRIENFILKRKRYKKL